MSQMSLDPMTLCLFVLTFLKFGGNLKAAQGEVNAYMNMLAIAVSLSHSVKATRLETWCPRALGARIDSQLQEISKALHDAGRDVSRMMHNTKDPHLHLLGTSDTLAWTLKYKDVAKANKTVLQLCINELHRIERELDQASASRPRAVEHFEATWMEMWDVQSTRAARRAALYEGKGERSVRMLG